MEMQSPQENNDIKTKITKKKNIIIALVIVILALLILAGSCALRQNNKATNNSQQKSTNSATSTNTTSDNKISDNKITLSDGTVINLSTSTASNSGQTASGTSGNTSGSGGSSGNGGQSNTGSTGNTGGTNSIPNNAGYLWSEKDFGYQDSTVNSPVFAYLLGKFDLTNDTGNDLNIDKVEIAFAFEHNFSESDLANVYIKINNKKYAIKNTVSASNNVWIINDAIIKQATTKVEIYGDIKSNTGDVWADSRMVSLIKIQATQKNGTKIYYSGLNNQNIFTVGQSIFVKTTQTAQPGQQPTPTPQPQPTPTSTPPSAVAGTLTVALNTNYMLTKPEQTLTGGNNNLLSFDIQANGEDMQMESIILKVINADTNTKANEAIDYAVLSSKLIPTGLKTSVQDVRGEPALVWSQANLPKIKKGVKENFQVRVYYNLGKKASGAIISLQADNISAIGVDSKKSIYASIGNIKSAISYIIPAKPQIVPLVLGDPQLQGGYQRELLHFKTKNITNSAEGQTNITLNYFDFNFIKLNASMNKGQLYYLSGNNWLSAGICFPLSQQSWRCLPTNAELVKTGSEIEYSFMADLGLKTTAALTSWVYFGSATSKGDISWTGDATKYVGSNPTYYWIDQTTELKTELTGGGNGSLFDSTVPTITKISLSNGGTQNKKIEKDDYIHIQFNEEIDPKSFSSAIIPYTYNYTKDNENGAVVACYDNSSLDLTYLLIRGVYKYIYPAFSLNSTTCNEYTTRINTYSGILHIYIETNGGYESPDFLSPTYATTLKDLNNNSLGATTAIPTGTF
jgi:hypothetical protein